jgi:hypothetical protein
MQLTKAVDIPTLELIKTLQSKDYLKGFYLVGGTALALSMSHRRSIDIDLFTNSDFDASQLLENIHQDFQYQLYYSASNTLKGSIFDIKVDFLAHRYPYLQEPRNINGIFVLSEQDIIAMKLNAISTSGQRSKDFIDIFYLLDSHPVAAMLNYYKTKYNQQNDTLILKSLIYFDEVDLSDWPVLLLNPRLKWGDVKKKLDKAVMKYIKEHQQ